MRAAEVKENLLRLHQFKENFSLEYSWKKSKRVNGKYVIDERKIIINERNFPEGEEGDSLLFYTAMHEAAHHIQHTEYEEKGRRSHTKLFYSLLDDLAERAEMSGLYRYEADSEVKALVDEAAGISNEIACLQKKLGEVLGKLSGACYRKGLRYEDVINRKVKISTAKAKKLKVIASLDLPSGTGFEIQEAIASTKGEDAREAMKLAAADNKSVARVKQAGREEKNKSNSEDEKTALIREKNQLEKSIASLKRRLEDILERIKKYDKGGG